MSFSNSELQQVRALIRAQIDKLEIDRIESKAEIAALVEKKQPFKAAGTKSVVDKINVMIKDEYRVLDSTSKKLKKLAKLQSAVKREMSEKPVNFVGYSQLSSHIHVEPGVLQKLTTTIDNPPEPNDALKTALQGFRDSVDALAQSKVSEGTVAEGCTLMGQRVDPSFRGWSDFKMENFHPTPPVAIGYDFPPYAPIFQNPDPSYDQVFLPGVKTVTLPYTIPDDNSMKLSNPKDAIGSDKLPIHLWPNTATAMGCIGFLNGMLKYGRANFRIHGIRASIYYDAAKRHLDAWFEGEECDPDDDVPHLAAALACIAIIVDADAAGKLNDDRNVSGGFRKLVDRLTPHVKRLKLFHASKSPKHYTIADNASAV